MKEKIEQTKFTFELGDKVRHRSAGKYSFDDHLIVGRMTIEQLGIEGKFQMYSIRSTRAVIHFVHEKELEIAP